MDLSPGLDAHFTSRISRVWMSDCSWLGLGTFLLQPLWVVVMTSDVGLKSFALMASRKITPAYLKSLWKTMQRRMMAAVDDQKGHRKC